MIDQLRAKIVANQFEYTRHALDQSILRNITVQELREAIENAEVIEDYPQDKYRIVLCLARPERVDLSTYNVVILHVNWSRLLPSTSLTPNNGLITK